MFHVISTVVFCLIFVNYSEGILKIGKCPNIVSIQNFDLTAFTGIWYEIESDPSLITFMKKCQAIEVKKQSEDKIEMKLCQRWSILNTKVDHIMDGTLQEDKTRGQFGLVSRSIFPIKNSQPYWVVDTDYKNYAVAVICENHLKTVYTQLAIIYSRTQTLSPQLLAKARQSLTSSGVNIKKMKKNNQNNCPAN